MGFWPGGVSILHKLLDKMSATRSVFPSSHVVISGSSEVSRIFLINCRLKIHRISYYRQSCFLLLHIQQVFVSEWITVRRSGSFDFGSNRHHGILHLYYGVYNLLQVIMFYDWLSPHRRPFEVWNLLAEFHWKNCQHSTHTYNIKMNGMRTRTGSMHDRDGLFSCGDSCPVCAICSVLVVWYISFSCFLVADFSAFYRAATDCVSCASSATCSYRTSTSFVPPIY